MSTYLRSICLANVRSRNKSEDLVKQSPSYRQAAFVATTGRCEKPIFYERCPPSITSPQGRPASLSKRRYGDRPISNSANFPHLWNESFLWRIRGSHVLRHTHYSFPRRHRRDGEALSRMISTTIQVTLRYVVIAPCINIEYNLDAKEE